MPELPEVETVRLGLERLLIGREVKAVESFWKKSFPNDEQTVQTYLVGAQVTVVRRRAKVLIIELRSGYSLVVHLKMTGQLVFRDGEVHFGAGHPNDSLVGDLPDKSTRVTVTFTDGAKLFFNDQRKFGWMRLLPTAEVSSLDFFQKAGSEPLGDSFTAEDFIARIRRRPRSVIKAVLLDQTVVAGVGNIYADESLFAAKIHPARRVYDVTDSQLKLLYRELRRILRLSIEKGGSTDKNYVDAEGKKGSYLTFAKVFRREGLACQRCGAIIIKTRVAGRGTHVCPVCQKLPEP